MNDITTILERLCRSSFRSRFRLQTQEQKYLQTKGMGTIRQHAADFIAKRLAPAHPTNDGKQTPWRGHPVFVAQHATATCCRGCIEKWHGIKRGHELSAEEQEYLVNVLEAWLRRQEAL